jgi:hypothetical protein
MKGLLYAALVSALLSSHALADPVDATPGLDAAAAIACASTESRTVNLPARTLTFLTRPKPFACALTLAGGGIGATVLERRYSGGSFLHWQRGGDHSGGALRNLSVLAGPGTSGGVAVLIEATPDTDGSVNSYNRHSFIIENVIVGRAEPSTATYWDFGLYLDGSLNPYGNPASVPGIRGVYVDKSTFGGAKTASIYLNRAIGTELRAECYTPINGGFAGVVLNNETDSVFLQTRNCAWASWDGTGKGMILNGARIGPQ